MAGLFETRDSSIQGQGLFAGRKIARGQLIAVLTPEIESRVNHHCRPNAGFRHHKHLYAYRDIEPGDEITYDYSATIGVGMDWWMACACDASDCRKKIGNVLTLPKDTLANYLKANLLPGSIREQVSPDQGRTLYEDIPYRSCPYLRAAQALKLPFRYLNSHGRLEIQLGKKKYNFYGGLTPFNDVASGQLSLHKGYVNQVLAEAGFPVPEALVLDREAYLRGDFQVPAFGFPLVVKPTRSYFGGGRDVYCNIQDEASLRAYLDEQFKIYTLLNLEKYEAGLTLYRVTVFFNRILGVVRHALPAVIGDGKHTLKELIAFENERRVKNSRADLEIIRVDRETEDLFKENLLDLSSVPALDQKVILSHTCNAARGASTESLGVDLCSENAELLCKAANLLNLNLVGFDILSEDLQKPLTRSRSFILEANANPDLNLHELPERGVPLPVAKIILRRLLKKHPLAFAQVLVKKCFPFDALLFRAVFALGWLLVLLKWLSHSR